jgi:hypothetical protein
VTFTVSPPVRIAAVVGLVAVVVIGGAMMMLNRKGDSTAAAPHAIKHHPFGSPTTKKPAAKPATSKPSPKRSSAPKPVRKSRPAPKPARPAVVAQALAAGLPRPLANALGSHSTVVVSLYNPYSTVDATAFAEARAGAKLSGAGFVPLNVLSQADVGQLTEKLGLLPDPSVLVFVGPGTLAGRITGFADKETVAQAAQNADYGG